LDHKKKGGGKKEKKPKIVTTCKAKYLSEEHATKCGKLRYTSMMPGSCPSTVPKPSLPPDIKLMPMSMVMLHVSWLNAFHKITFNGFQLTKCILGTKIRLTLDASTRRS